MRQLNLFTHLLWTIACVMLCGGTYFWGWKDGYHENGPRPEHVDVKRVADLALKIQSLEYELSKCKERLNSK